MFVDTSDGPKANRLTIVDTRSATDRKSFVVCHVECREGSKRVSFAVCPSNPIKNTVEKKQPHRAEIPERVLVVGNDNCNGNGRELLEQQRDDGLHHEPTIKPNTTGGERRHDRLHDSIVETVDRADCIPCFGGLCRTEFV